MSVASNPDRFEIINGPEDGTQFPVIRTPLDLGSDGRCPVNIQFDGKVEPLHARISVVEGGYRVRRCGGGTVQVDGKRVGRIRSRIIRHGGILTAGGTELCLQLAGHGLASRSYGINLESDSGWLVRTLVSQSRTVAGFILGALARFARRRPILTLCILAGVGGYLYYRQSAETLPVGQWIGWAIRWMLYFLSQAVRRFQELFG